MVIISRAQEIVDRLKTATQATSDSMLADKIGITQQAVSSARKGKVPDAWARIALSRFGISADWFYTGIGPMLFERAQMEKQQQSAHATVCDDCRNAELLLAQRDKRIRDLERELQEAREAERKALWEANAALKRLLEPADR